MAPNRPYRLGVLTAGALAAGPVNAASAYTEVRDYDLVIPGIAGITVRIARKEPTGTERGTVVMFSGQDGTGWYSQDSGLTETWIDTLKTEGWRVFQVKWATGWPDTVGVGNHGPVIMSARPATVVKWIYDNHVAAAVRNLVVTGNSGGSDQSAYCMTHHNLDALIDGVVMSGGPPRSNIRAGCNSEASYSYEVSSRNEVDDSYDQGAGAGPCELAATGSKGSAWDYDTIRRGFVGWSARSYYLWGSLDTTTAPVHGESLAILQPGCVRSWPTAAPHDVQTHLRGRQAIADAMNDRALIRQAILNGSGTATSVTATFAKTVKVGTLLAAAHKANTAAANITTPAGWTITKQVVIGTGTLTIFHKVAASGDTGITMVTSTAVLQALDLFEVDQRATTTWVVDQTDDTPAAASVTTITAGPTVATTQAKEWCLAAVGWSGTPGTVNDDWSNSYVTQGSNGTGRLATAARSVDATGAQSTALTWVTVTNAAALLATFKAS